VFYVKYIFSRSSTYRYGFHPSHLFAVKAA